MADRVDSMSDAELRTKLAEHGFPVMPITASTRKLLVKKLKLVLDKGDSRNGSVAKDSRHSLAKYSSGEDSDLDAVAGTQRKGRRATTGGTMPPPVAAKTRRQTPKKESPAKKVEVERESESEEENKSPVKTHEEIETVTTRRITRMYNADEYETGSDSDVDVDKKSAPFRSDSRSSDYISSTLPSLEDRHISPPKNSYLSSRSTTKTGYVSPLSGTDSLNTIRSRLGLTTSLGGRTPLGVRPSTGYTSSYQSTSGSDEVESPYLSNFAKRLTTLNAEPVRASAIERDGGSGSYVRKPYVSSAPRGLSEYRSFDKKFLQGNFVSFALKAIVFVFFVFLAYAYLVKKNDLTSLSDNTPICQLTSPNNRPSVNCVPKDQVAAAKDLLKTLQPVLSQRSAEYNCGKRKTPFLTDKEIRERISTIALNKDLEQIRTDIANLQVLLIKNPDWGVSIVQSKALYSDSNDYQVLTEMEDLVRYHQADRGLMLTDSYTPVFCLLTSTMYYVGSIIFLGAIILAGVFVSHRGWKMYQTRQKRRNDEIYSMVEQILDIICQECEDSGEPYISVAHVRDMLIAPQNRDRMTSVWEAAIAFINKNESRVRMEVQSVDGEDCEVWRWVSPRGSPRTSAAAWQGQAFETQEGSVNNLSISPTQCLKIRHMFDKSDTGIELRTIIQDAILEKVKEQCNILHIDLDRSSCCVYVKCASPKDAGVVYRSLHGWWYKGKLITVKYLRLERYMMRFPNSPTVGPFLNMSRTRNNNTWDN